MSILASGTGIAKIIGLAAMPFITRIYTPEHFGILAVFTAALVILLVFADMRYIVALLLPKSDELAFNLFILILSLIGLITLFCTIILLFYGELIFAFFNMVEITSYWWLLILGLAGASIFELLSQWAIRKKSFDVVAKTSVWQSVFSASAKIGLGLFGLKPIGLLIGVVLKKAGGILAFLKIFLKDFRNYWYKVTFKKIFFLLRYYKELPMYSLPSQFLLIVAGKIPVLYFAFQFGSNTTGQLGLAMTVIGIPIGLLGRSTGQAFYSEIARIGKDNSEKIYNLSINILKRLAIVSILPCTILLFGSPFLFQLIFGSEWYQAGLITSILTIYLFFQFLSLPFINILNVLNLQNIYFKINLSKILLATIPFTLSYFFEYEIYSTLILYTIFMSIYYTYSSYAIFSIIKPKQ
ncbi:lipopolysaccharide biosynthesis protein [Rhodohalobacter sp. SW132]|uniref:lipopolysaccharide biosynthesis protein n=1 Tax=Rhodohalobacter sp. SW132 TaxID=2293433 RepID=UPI0011C043BB|nr:oligosaccharide flippase family protein [Rhodohalobacter sp. SW132]